VKWLKKQKIISGGFEERDVVAMASDRDNTCVMVFFVRGGKLIGREQFMLKGTGGLSRLEVLGAFIKQYYNTVDIIPGEILLQEDLAEEGAVIESWLTMKRGARVRLKKPLRGEKKEAGGDGGQKRRHNPGANSCPGGCPPQRYSRCAGHAGSRPGVGAGAPAHGML
jgi:excinuclease UvrABC nuclease subunit